MRRVSGLWPEVTSFANLMRASQRAARGKRGQRTVARFLAEREGELLALRRELLGERYPPGAHAQLRDPRSQAADDQRRALS